MKGLLAADWRQYDRRTQAFAQQLRLTPFQLFTTGLAVLLHRLSGQTDFAIGTPVALQTASVDEFIDAGIAFAGTPDDVFAQIKEFNDHVGGLGHLLMMGQGGHLSHEDTVSNLTLFSQEVLPRLAEL